MDFLKLLSDRSIIADWIILADRRWESGFYYKIRIIISDASTLQASEYNDIRERNYSFHWQDEQGKLIIRWDNAPHYPHIKTFPHHKHLLDRIEESEEMTLEAALNVIEKMLTK